MRVDFNVSINNNGIIGEDYRIRMTIPTIEYLTKRGAKLILMSHLGRPTSDQDSHYSLAPLARRLSEIMPANKVRFAADCVGEHVQKEIDEMNMCDILLLENLRFHKEEENNDPDFSSSGAYHLEAPFLKGNSNYTIRAEIAAINGKQLQNKITDDFSLKTIT
jgi:phosphoglycerate kinase